MNKVTITGHNENRRQTLRLGWVGLLPFVRKEFRHIFRDGRSMLILLVYPVILIVLFGYAVTTEVKNVRVAVLDSSHDEVTRLACDRISSNSYMTLVASVGDIDQVYSLFRRGKADVAVVFGSNFANDIKHDGLAQVQLLVDGTEPNQAVMRAQYVGSVLSDVGRELSGRGTFGAAPAINPVPRMLYNPQQKSEYNFVPGVIGMILMLICAMMSSIAIVREKENGTMEVLLSSPLSPACIVIAKLVPYFVISAFNIVTILLLACYLLGVPMAGSLPVLLGVTLLYILVALTLGLLISTLVRTQIAAMVLSLLLIIPTVYLSGLAFPLESMPGVLRAISTIVPARWYIDAARKLMIQGVEARFVMQDVWAMVITEAVLLGISLKKFKVRL